MNTARQVLDFSNIGGTREPSPTPMRMAMAQPTLAATGVLALITANHHCDLYGRTIARDGGGGSREFVLSDAFTPTASIAGSSAYSATYLGLFQQSVVTRWRWRLLEGCADAPSIARRLMVIAHADSPSWWEYQSAVLSELLDALLAGRGGCLNEADLIRDLGTAISREPEHPLKPLWPRWRRMLEALPTGFELSIPRTLQLGGTIYAFLDAMSPGYWDQIECLLDTVADRMSIPAHKATREALESADLVLVNGFSDNSGKAPS